MFINQTQLRHLLRPDQYMSERQYRTELRHLFDSTWHPLATTRDIAKPGDILTFDLLETPILIRNFDGELRAFLNVCPHRHSRLIDKPKANSERLKCQYHGWEFDQEGRTGKIPDARAFRPWDRENACLRRFRLETCGELVFVNFSDNGMSLREWLGPLWETWSAGFGGDYRYATTWEQDFPCNWKVVLENSLESYHIPQVHPKTFKEYPEESNSWHVLDPQYSTFRTMAPDDWLNRRLSWAVRQLGVPVTNEYWHHVRHPHVTFASLDIHRMMMCVFPISPTACRYRSIVYTLRGRRRNPLAWALAHCLRPAVVAVGKKVFAEDGAIYEGVQRGLAASPNTGVW
ncbi:aromatic ring-hydroxylating oxygenase subunit alpha [Fimbriiglobus ruber]|uniref:Large subunit aromatic oxygenase n=1 Tax=Fimbriiglobus ruber TaxID=1908690 RepID=A0A225DSJ2_9BACT|nr:aromatic ring-hydroxylating dioxygenase subunit alpha [Fimbriiglobus ruber]OWK39365.1 large subunit aromatic oxygenase [Fimbriiglobus ruber]